MDQPYRAKSVVLVFQPKDSLVFIQDTFIILRSNMYVFWMVFVLSGPELLIP